MADIEEVLGRVVRAERTVEVCVRGDLAEKVRQLHDELAAAIMYDADHNEPPTSTEVHARIEEAKAEADAATVTFKVQAIPATEWRRLVSEHPPADDDLDGWRWDLETFPPAALAAACVDPVMDEVQADRLAEALSNAQWEKLFGAVLAVNLADDVPKFAGGIEGLLTSAPSSTTAPDTESLTASS